MTILYIEKPEKSTQKGANKQVQQVTQYKIIIVKSIVFLYTSNEQSDKKIKKKSHLQQHQKE